MSIYLLLFAMNTYAADCVNCKAPQKLPVDVKILKNIDEKVKLQELESLAQKNSDHVIKYFLEPDKKTCSTISYKFPDLKMKPNDSVYFHVPEEFRNRGVRFMVLGHRQEPGPENIPNTWDNNPGLSSVQIHSDKGWNYWSGPASGKQGAKFAEVRSDAEIENLYDWDHYGHTNLSTKTNSTDVLLPDAMKVTSVGTDFVLLSELTLKVNPPKEVDKQETIYSPGTAFTPNNPEKKYVLSGGQNFKGKFPAAMALSGNEISIPLKAGLKITTIDVACGDSHPDGIQNSDGGWGTQGWAKLSIGIKNKSGSIKWLMNKENVPPEGVLMTSPESCDEKTEEGSEVIIKSDDDTTYVMGVHVGFGE
jgi:hypothetical protein